MKSEYQKIQEEIEVQTEMLNLLIKGGLQNVNKVKKYLRGHIAHNKKSLAYRDKMKAGHEERERKKNLGRPKKRKYPAFTRMNPESIERRDGIIFSLSWVARMIRKPVELRKKSVELALKNIINFNKGKPTKEGKDFSDSLRSKNYELYGFVPYIPYIKADSEYEDQLNCLWVHPFHGPTLLFKHKKLPFLIVTNSELMSNDSMMAQLNEHIVDWQQTIGLTG